MRTNDPRFIEILQCPSCQAIKLTILKDIILCAKCQTHYPIRDSVLYLTLSGTEMADRYASEAELPINRFKTFLKKWPKFFNFLIYAAGSVSFFGRSPWQTVKKEYGEATLVDKIIINVGSGTTTTHPEIINLDIFPFQNVNIVTDAARLPFQDNSVDMVISESTLEHIPDADAAIKEISRVIKPRGMIYVSIPFIMPFHASPNDYLRLTHEGLKQKFSAFKMEGVGTRGGPASALVTFLMYFLALPFSIISESAYNFAAYFFMVLLSPFRIFDLIFLLFPKSIEASAFIYFIGCKKQL